MKISTKGRYALRLAVDLAVHQSDGYISLKSIASRQSISPKYLEQIVPLLIRSGILIANRGNKGGYMLAKKPSEITVGDILRAAEGSLAPVSCLIPNVNDCPNAPQCMTLYVWEGLHRTVTQYLDSISLRDIADRGAVYGNNYCI